MVTQREQYPWWKKLLGEGYWQKQAQQMWPMYQQPLSSVSGKMTAPRVPSAYGPKEPLIEFPFEPGKWISAPRLGAPLHAVEKTLTARGETPVGITPSVSEVAGIAAIGYIGYQGVRSLIPLTKEIGDKALQTALNAGLDKWIAQRSRGVPPQQLKKVQDFLYSVIAKNRTWLQQRATENMLRRRGKTPNVSQATKQAVEDTINDVDQMVSGLVPKGTQTGAMAFGGKAWDKPIKPIPIEVTAATQRFVDMPEEEFESLATKGKMAPFGQIPEEIKAVAKGKKPVARIAGGDVQAAKDAGLIVARIPTYKGDPARLDVWAAVQKGPEGREAFKKLSEALELVESGAVNELATHVTLGRAFGYSEADIATYLKDFYGSKAGIEAAAKETSQVAKGGVPPPETPAPPTAPAAPEEEFAGNIRLEKFDESVQPLIKEWAEANPALVEQARRGVIPDEQVLKMAENLVRDTGGDFAKLLKRWKPGEAWNAEEITALRGILQSKVQQIMETMKLVRTGQDTTINHLRLQSLLEEHAAVQKAVHGITAEAGRALRSFRQAVSDSIRDNDTARMMEILDRLGGKGNIKDIADKLGRLDLANPEMVNKFIRDAVQPKFWDYIVELFYNSILSGPKTHIVNATSNTGTTVFSPMERLVSAGVELPMHWVQRRGRERFFGEVAADTLGLLRGIPEGARAALYIWQKGVPLEQTTKWELRRNAFPDWFIRFGKIRIGKAEIPLGIPFGKAIRIPTSTLEAADAFGYAINRRASLWATAYREASKKKLSGQALADEIIRLTKEPTEAILTQAHLDAEYRLFRKTPGTVTQAVIKLRNAEVAGIQPLRFVIPFLRTPTNLVKFGLERSPLGLVNPHLWKNFFTRSPKVSDDIARVVIGSLVGAALATYAADGKITGQPPQNKAERDLFYQQGKIPYAVKIGETWVSYQRMEPINQVLAQVAAFVEAIHGKEKDKTVDEIAGTAVNTLASNLVSQTYMSGLSNLLNALDDPERYGGTFAQRAMSGLVPFSSALRTAEQVRSPIVRKPEGIWQGILAGLPVIGGSVKAKLTALGEETQRAGPQWFPIALSSTTEDKVILELAEADLPIGFTDDAVWGIDLTPEEAYGYQMFTGRLIKQNLAQLIESKEYKKLTKLEVKKDKIAGAVREARNLARQTVIDSLYQQGKLPEDKKLLWQYDIETRGQDQAYKLRYREVNPLIDAVLNISGSVTTVRSEQARLMLISLADGLGIPYSDIPALNKPVEQGKSILRK